MRGTTRSPSIVRMRLRCCRLWLRLWLYAAALVVVPEFIIRDRIRRRSRNWQVSAAAAAAFTSSLSSPSLHKARPYHPDVISTPTTLLTRARTRCQHHPIDRRLQQKGLIRSPRRKAIRRKNRSIRSLTQDHSSSDSSTHTTANGSGSSKKDNSSFMESFFSSWTGFMPSHSHDDSAAVESWNDESGMSVSDVLDGKGMPSMVGWAVAAARRRTLGNR